jgi:N-acetylglucosaminyldiphosphoundecaprenol N-acetyl-beta-D-mannosaminyltransferase
METTERAALLQGTLTIDSRRARGRASMPRTAVLGVQCFVGSIDEATACVLERVRSEEGGYACLCNVHVLVTAQHDPQLRRALNRAWTVFPDGFPVAWLARRAERDAARVAGADLMDAVLGAGGGLRHFLLGSTPTVLEALAAVRNDWCRSDRRDSIR